MLFQGLMYGIIYGTMVAVLGLGYALIYNTTKVFHIAYAAIFIIAPYMLLFFQDVFQTGLWISSLLAIAVTAIVSILIDRIFYVPLQRRGSSQNAILIVSIGLMTILINTICLAFGNELYLIIKDWSFSWSFFGYSFQGTLLLQLLSGVIVILLLGLLLQFTRLGILIRAMGDNQELCPIFAVPISRLRYILFGLSGILAAIGSILLALDTGMDPFQGMPILLQIIIALVVGGLGRYYTVVLGAYLVGIVESLSTLYWSANWSNTILFLLLISFLLFRPQGILGDKKRLV